MVRQEPRGCVPWQRLQSLASLALVPTHGLSSRSGPPGLGSAPEPSLVAVWHGQLLCTHPGLFLCPKGGAYGEGAFQSCVTPLVAQWVD